MTGFYINNRPLVFAISLVFSAGYGIDAKAASLTPAGAAEFTLSTFADGFAANGGGAGPLGIAFPGGGAVMTTDSLGNVRVFPTDADNQHAGSVPVAQNYGFGNSIGLASSGGKIFMTQQGNSSVVQVNNNGTFNQTIASGLPFVTGIATNPATNNLYVSTPSNSSIYEVNPTTHATTLFSPTGADGLVVNSNGTTLYAASGSHVLGFDTTTKTQIFDSGVIPGTPDGIALGASGPLANKLFVNTNGGEVIEVDILTLLQTVILTGGTRGDFVTVDLLNGSLLLTQTNSILRLTPLSGGFEGVTTPTPAALPLFATGLAGLGWLARRRRKQAA